MMKPFAVLLFATLCAASLLPAQVNLRNPDINAEADDGALIAEAAISEDVEERIGILERFVEQFPESQYMGYGLLQLQGGYVQTQQHEKTVETGKKLLELAPDDVEVRHNINQALVALQRWEELYPLLVETRPLAEEAAETPQPADADEDELAVWQGRVDYAAGVTDYLQWAMNTAMTQQTQPAQKIAWLDRLRENYPDADVSKGLERQYVTAYQQQGDMANAVEWMKKAVEAGVADETYHFTLSEDALNRQDNETARAEAEKMLAVLEAKEKPANMSDEQWEAHKAKMEAYGNFNLGRAWVSENTKDAYRAGRTHLLKTVDVIKAEGGPRYSVLSYLLGVCYVQLDIQGDNIKQAIYWMTEAANAEGPFQGQAKEALGKIKSAI